MMENSIDTEDILIHAEHANGEQGIHEMEISCAGENGFQRSFKNCTKNPGHKKFIPLDKFDLNNLPQNVRTIKTLFTIHQLAAGTVKLTVNFISKKIPSTLPFANSAGESFFTVGSGYVAEIPKSEDKKEFPCPFTDCQEQSGTHSVYGYITVVTAAHLVCNAEEAENITVEFFYDSPEDKSGVRKARGLRLGAACHEGDFCELVCVTHDALLFKKARCVSVTSYLLPLEIMKTKLMESFGKDFNEMKQSIVKFSLSCTCNSNALRTESKESVILTKIGDIKKLISKLSIERNAVIQPVKAFPLSCRYFYRDISFDIHFISKLFEKIFPVLKSSYSGDTITFHLPARSNPGQLLLFLHWDVPAIRTAIYKYLEISCPSPNLLKHFDPAYFNANSHENDTGKSSYTGVFGIINHLPTIRDIETFLGENFIRKHSTSVLELNDQLSRHNIKSLNRVYFMDETDDMVTFNVTFLDQDHEHWMLQEPASAECTTSYRCPDCMLIICVCPIMYLSKLDLRNISFQRFPASYMRRNFKTKQLKSDEYSGMIKDIKALCQNRDKFNFLRHEKMSLLKEVGVNSLVIHISHPHGQSKHVTIGELTQCWTENGHYHSLYTADTCPGSSGGPTWVISRNDPKKTFCFTHSGCEGNKLNKGSAWNLYPVSDIIAGLDFWGNMGLFEHMCKRIYLW